LTLVFFFTHKVFLKKQKKGKKNYLKQKSGDVIFPSQNGCRPRKINDNWLIFFFFSFSCFAYRQPGVVVVLQTVALKSMVRFVVDCCFGKHNHVHATHGSLGKGHDTAGFIHFEVIMVTNSAKIRKIVLVSSIPL
jgi:hypothetical protein